LAGLDIRLILVPAVVSQSVFNNYV
jgi:hypothetical protein